MGYEIERWQHIIKISKFTEFCCWWKNKEGSDTQLTWDDLPRRWSSVDPFVYSMFEVLPRSEPNVNRPTSHLRKLSSWRQEEENRNGTLNPMNVNSQPKVFHLLPLKVDRIPNLNFQGFVAKWHKLNGFVQNSVWPQFLSSLFDMMNCSSHRTCLSYLFLRTFDSDLWFVMSDVKTSRTSFLLPYPSVFFMCSLFNIWEIIKILDHRTHYLVLVDLSYNFIYVYTHLLLSRDLVDRGWKDRSSWPKHLLLIRCLYPVPRVYQSPTKVT